MKQARCSLLKLLFNIVLISRYAMSRKEKKYEDIHTEKKFKLSFPTNGMLFMYKTRTNKLNQAVMKDKCVKLDCIPIYWQ